jgi:hypothetical protein
MKTFPFYCCVNYLSNEEEITPLRLAVLAGQKRNRERFLEECRHGKRNLPSSITKQSAQRNLHPKRDQDAIDWILALPDSFTKRELIGDITGYDM